MASLVDKIFTYGLYEVCTEIFGTKAEDMS